MTQTAINYGRVLLQLEIPKEDILKTGNILKESQPLCEALESPLVKKQEKAHIIQRVFPNTMHHFLMTVCDYQAAELLEEILQAYEEEYCNANDILRAVLYCVKEPDEAQLLAIKKKLCERFDAKEAQILIEQKPELIGGFVIRIGDLEIDNSLLGSWKDLGRRLNRR